MFKAQVESRAQRQSKTNTQNKENVYEKNCFKLTVAGSVRTIT